ncbi:unnamed protein product [Dicrocoelium dendriticum]|nr:unnamed protein product [Dicrocoelium dendriticum]
MPHVFKISSVYDPILTFFLPFLDQSDNSCTAAMLVRLVHLFRLFPRCEVLFDSETEVGGPYRPDVDNPELCMPASACLWELTLLSKHTSPVVRELANAALHWGRMIHLHGPTEAALKEYKTNFGFGAPTLDQLTQLPPTECRLVLSELDAAFREKSRAMPTEPLTQGRKRKRLFCAPPQWLLYSVESVGLPEDLLPAYYTKKQRLDV